MPMLARAAASVVHEVRAGARASSLLASVLSERRASAEEAEQLSRLVYGALRRERRVEVALREAAIEIDTDQAALLHVIGAALIEGSMALPAAREVLQV